MKEPSLEDPEIAREYEEWSAANSLANLEPDQRARVEELAARMSRGGKTR